MNMSNKSVTKVVAIIAANIFAIAFANTRADDVQRVKLFVRETPITVNDRTINMCSVCKPTARREIRRNNLAAFMWKWSINSRCQLRCTGMD